MAGGSWPERARRAARELSSGTARLDDSIGVRLLADVRAVFESRNVDRITTTDLIDALAEDAESPWSSWRDSERISPRGLARLLRPFGIRRGTIRLDDSTTAKGYQRSWFEDAWSRYTDSNRSQGSQATTIAGSAAAADGSHNGHVTDGRRLAEPHESWFVTDVTDTGTDRSSQNGDVDDAGEPEALRALREGIADGRLDPRWLATP